MSKIEEYKTALSQTHNREEYLLQHSNLPGPRGNLELLYAAAEILDEAELLAFCALPVEIAGGNTPHGFLVCCGVTGLGRLTNAGKYQYWQTLRHFASDERWRVREAVAMALQLVGDADIDQLLGQMRAWQSGSLLEQRAAAAGLCEPRLLKRKEVAQQVLRVLDAITASICLVQERKSEEFVVLKKGLSYAWSVAVAADPQDGKPLMEKWISSSDKDITRIMKENLQKNRLIKMDEVWVQVQLARLSG